MSYSTKDFYYDLPPEFVAQTPIAKRDHSRLMVLDRAKGTITHRHFYDIGAYLNAGDLLVMNNTRVLPARIYGRRTDTGGKIELLLLKRLHGDLWETMVKPGKKAKPGVTIAFGDRLTGRICALLPDGLRSIEFSYEGVFEEILEEIGTMPLPPYIHETLADQNRYQTVYARENGSAAAPTAGLHFTDGLLADLKQQGVQKTDVTLHVGLGTFRPVKADKPEEHHMHTESYVLSAETARLINETKERGKRVVAVGTTSVRTLESVAAKNDGHIAAAAGDTDIFIYPGYKWQVVDALITNFHLPESTLLMLVSAFYDREKILAAYREAIAEHYRFFSFGDAMLIV